MCRCTISPSTYRSLGLALSQAPDPVKVIVAVQSFEQVDPRVVKIRVEVQSIFPRVAATQRPPVSVGAQSLEDEVFPSREFGAEFKTGLCVMVMVFGGSIGTL